MTGRLLRPIDFIVRAQVIEDVIRYLESLPKDDLTEADAHNYLASKLAIDALKWRERARKESK